MNMRRGAYICANSWIFFKTLHINGSLYTNYENVFIELDVIVTINT